MMWFGKSSSVSGICTVVDMRLWIQRLQRKSDKAARERCESLEPTVSVSPADPDVPTRPRCSDLWTCWGLDERTQLWSYAFNTQDESLLRQWGVCDEGTEREEKFLLLTFWRRCLSAGTEAAAFASTTRCVRWRHTGKKKKWERASSFLVGQSHSHKSVNGQFLTHLRQHRLDLSLPLKHKRPSVWVGGRRVGVGWNKRLAVGGDVPAIWRLFHKEYELLYGKLCTVGFINSEQNYQTKTTVTEIFG